MWNTIKLLFFIIHSLTLISLSLCIHLKELNTVLLQIVSSRNFFDLKCIYREINSITIEILQSDTGLISNLFFAAYLSQLPLNINLIAILTFRNLFLNEQIFLAISAFLQIAFPLIAAQVLILVVTFYYRLHQNLYKIQLGLDKNGDHFLQRKWKLLVNYELNCTEKKVSFTIGSLSKLSGESFAKVSVPQTQ